MRLNLKAVLSIILISMFLTATATSSSSISKSIVFKNKSLKIEKDKVQLNRFKKATEITEPVITNKAFCATVVENNIETTYQPIFEQSKVKIIKKTSK